MRWVLVALTLALGLEACSSKDQGSGDDRFNPDKHKDMANIYKQYEATPAPGK